MKNLLFLLLFIPNLIYTQDTCTGLIKNIIHSNRVGASLYPNGFKFYGEEGFFKVPYTSQAATSTIYGSNAWIGAYRNGQLKIAAQLNALDREIEYQVGPLSEGSIPLDSACLQFNHIWSVNRDEIISHIEDYESDGIIDDTVGSVFGWPAEGNTFFKAYNSFSLPSSHQGGWADFYDANQNGLYEPGSGDYPCIYLNGVPYLPERMMWMVYNDQREHLASKGQPLGVEIQLTVYGFNCEDNPVLRNALFNSYKVINQQEETLDSMYFGMWTDYDLGCAYDDYVGCDTIRHTEFVYNADEADGDIGFDCSNSVATTYAALPPIQSFTYLSHPMHSFSNGRILIPIPVDEYYNALKGLWPDGTPITVFNDGYNPGGVYPTTKFLFSGDPRDTTQWSQVSIHEQPGDKKTLSSISLGQLAGYEAVRIDGAYIFHQDSNLQHLEQIAFMQQQVDDLLSDVATGQLTCTPFQDCQGTDCVWPGDFNHNGKADHIDLLTWGVAKDQEGTNRNGLFDWDGYHAEPWSLNLPEGLNAKYADGNGDGIINGEDLERNIQHFSFTNPFYTEENLYPPGPHLVMTAQPINASGNIRALRIFAGQEIPNVLGLAYEIEFDTSLFTLGRTLTLLPRDTNCLGLTSMGYEDLTTADNYSPFYAFVQTDHLPILIEDGFLFQRDWPSGGLRLRPDLGPDDIPDSTIIRLKNLIAIDADGNDLHIGSEPLVVYREGIVGFHDPLHTKTIVYPNPTDDFIQIVTDFETEAQLFSLQGQLMRQIQVDELKGPIDVSVFPPGLYILRILATGESVKVVVQ